MKTPHITHQCEKKLNDGSFHLLIKFVYVSFFSYHRIVSSSLSSVRFIIVLFSVYNEALYAVLMALKHHCCYLLKECCAVFHVEQSFLSIERYFVKMVTLFQRCSVELRTKFGSLDIFRAKMLSVIHNT